MKGLGALAAGSVVGSAMTGSAAGDIGDGAVYQYYHTDWQEITNNLSAVADAGYDAIQVPPAQFSRIYKYERQYDRYTYDVPLGYQPIDFTDFNSVFGTESEYQTMVDEAHRQGLDVIADAVMNHLASGDDTFDRQVSIDDIPRFSENDLHPECSIDYNDPDSVEDCWLVSLRDLDQSSSYVRGELYNYLKKYAELSVDGVRFDAAKHMPEWFFRDYANQWADQFGLYKVGEVLDGSTSMNQQYADTGMSVTDYALYYTLKEDVFKSGGDMNALQGAGLVNQDPSRALTFVSNHDSEPPELEKLAHAYILTYEGYPRVYNHRIGVGDSDISNLLSIRRNILSGSAIDRHVDSDLYVFERDGSGLVAINNSGGSRSQWVPTSWTDQALEEHTGNASNIQTNGDAWVQVSVPARSYAVWSPDDSSGGGGGSLEGTYALIAQHSGKCADVSGISTDTGANIHQWDYGGGDNQHWEAVDNGDGTYRLVAQHSNKVLAVEGGGTSNGDNVVQWDWTGAQDQRWEIVDNDDGTYRLINANSGKCLDVSGGESATDNGDNVHQWDYVGGDNQKWELRSV
jgi:alpha-amylase